MPASRDCSRSRQLLFDDRPTEQKTTNREKNREETNPKEKSLEGKNLEEKILKGKSPAGKRD